MQINNNATFHMHICMMFLSFFKCQQHLYKNCILNKKKSHDKSCVKIKLTKKLLIPIFN